MNEHKPFQEESLYILREVGENPSLNQRLLAEKLNISLGKTNYLLRELIKKGIIKIGGFSKTHDKKRRLQYLLTPKGVEEKIALTYHFLKAKEKEYRRLKEEYDNYLHLLSSQKEDLNAK